MIDKQKYIDELNQIKFNNDKEEAHMQANGVLCEILTKLGYNDIVDLY